LRGLAERKALERAAGGHDKLIAFLRGELARLAPPDGLGRDARTQWRMQAWDKRRAELVAGATLDENSLAPEEKRGLGGWSEIAARGEIARLAQRDLDRLAAGKPVKLLLRAPAQARLRILLGSPRRLGDPERAHLLIAFHGLGCAECTRGSRLLARIVAERGAKLFVAANDYFAPVTPASMRAAIALRCADEQEKWWPLFAALAKKERLGFDELVAAARALGLDGDRFAACLDADRYLPDVIESLQLAEHLGLTGGAPGLFLDGVRLDDRGDVRKQIDALTAQE
jgi:hypothetical protein